ncbi:MAG: hypothetical protein HKN79_12450 [Flavobacteriales bacterium]|nr:hypothetical protein [Flavobacteriales bacterium]
MRKRPLDILKAPADHPVLLIALILIIRLPILGYFLAQGHEHFSDRMIDTIVLKEVDYGYFLLPVDNYFEIGTYSWGNIHPYAGRMPGYAAPYYLLRTVFDQMTALRILIILQVVLTAISIYFLALLAYRLTRSRRIFWMVFLFYGTSLYFLRYDFSTITESPSVALFILAIYHLFSYWRDKKWSRLPWAGFFFTWAIFLRPFLGYLLVPIGIILLIKGFKDRKTFMRSLRPAFLFCLPFLIIEGLWIGRNYEAFGRFIPLETPMHESYGKPYSKAWLATRALASSLDIETAYFEPGLAQWFRASSEEDARAFQMPEKWFEGVEFDRDSLEMLRNVYMDFKTDYDPERSALLEEEIISIADRYRSQVRSARPFTYHVINPLRNVKRRVFTSGSSYVLLPSFNQMNLFQKALKIYASLSYYAVFLLGYIGLILLCMQSKDSMVRNFCILALFHCIALPLILPFTPATLENRYLFTLYPLLCIGLFYLVDRVGLTLIRNPKRWTS